MGPLIESSPFILGGAGLFALIVAAIIGVASKQKHDSKLYKIINFVGFVLLFTAAAFAIWIIATGLHR